MSTNPVESMIEIARDHARNVKRWPNGGMRLPWAAAGMLVAARARVWAAASPDAVTLDFDATLVNAYSDKQDAAANYKKGFGFHPLGVWCDQTKEALAAMLRPGNAGANTATDHIAMLDAAVCSTPC